MRLPARASSTAWPWTWRPLYLGLELGGIDVHRLPHLQAAGDGGAGDHGAETLDGEDPVDGQPEDALDGFRRNLLGQLRQGGQEFLLARPR